MAFRLSIEKGEGQGQAFDFYDPTITVGRSEENDIVLYDSGVSRHHSTIALVQGRYVLSDHDTSNGTLLNGSRIASEPLENGDTIGIGDVVFRFDAFEEEEEHTLAGQPQDGGDSTRIVTHPKPELAGAAHEEWPEDERTNPGDGSSSGLGAGGKTDPKKLLAIGLGGVVLFLGIVMLAGREGEGAKANVCPDVLVLKEGLEDYAFGDGVASDCDAQGSLVFGFDHAERNRVILHYEAFRIARGEVEILVNGNKVSEVPLSPASRGARQIWTVPEKLLKPGQQNLIEFALVEGGADGVWGLRRVKLETIGLDEADLEKAVAYYDLGVARYRERAIAAPNLYEAWENLRLARRHMEGLEPKPQIYKSTLDLIRDVEKALDKLCTSYKFAAYQQINRGNLRAANLKYRFILRAFPGKDHPCRQFAEDNTYVVE